jgi:hypothetical protein
MRFRAHTNITTLLVRSLSCQFSTFHCFLSLCLSLCLSLFFLSSLIYLVFSCLVLSRHLWVCLFCELPALCLCCVDGIGGEAAQAATAGGRRAGCRQGCCSVSDVPLLGGSGEAVVRYGVLFAICMDLDAGSTKAPRPWLSGAHGLATWARAFWVLGPHEATEIERLDQLLDRRYLPRRWRLLAKTN